MLPAVLHVGALTELVGGFDETGKNKLPIDYPPFKRSKCYYMLLIFERGCSQLFPGTKILKNDSVAEENARCEVGAVNTEEITSQIGKFQSSTIGKPFVIVCRFRKMWLMHPDIARSNFTSSVLFGY